MLPDDLPVFSVFRQPLLLPPPPDPVAPWRGGLAEPPPLPFIDPHSHLRGPLPPPPAPPFVDPFRPWRW